MSHLYDDTALLQRLSKEGGGGRAGKLRDWTVEYDVEGARRKWHPHQLDSSHGLLERRCQALRLIDPHQVVT